MHSCMHTHMHECICNVLPAGRDLSEVGWTHFSSRIIIIAIAMTLARAPCAEYPSGRPSPKPRVAAWAVAPGALHKNAAIAAPLVAKCITEARLGELARPVPVAYTATACHDEHHQEKRILAAVGWESDGETRTPTLSACPFSPLQKMRQPLRQKLLQGHR